MNEIRDIYTEKPFYGYRKIRADLARKGLAINRKKVQRLMRAMELKSVCPKKNTTVRNKADAVYPYLLKNLDIAYPNQVWQVDITYIKIRAGFIYLVCLIDVCSRKIMGWHISTFLESGLCIRALEVALLEAVPEIINSDQGCQFTSDNWCKKLVASGIKISMDGKGRWADNVYIERLWRNIKYELVYLYRFETVSDARSAIANYIEFYNTDRPHQSLQYKTPDEVYREFENVKNREKKLARSLPLFRESKVCQISGEKLS